MIPVRQMEVTPVQIILTREVTGGPMEGKSILLKWLRRQCCFYALKSLGKKRMGYNRFMLLSAIILVFEYKAADTFHEAPALLCVHSNNAFL
mmetsp:Transcript_19152/g.30959  ORF Transcript_19152/g.30959 Transcript_19152/m.30959 type:complete len:92 (+) Transcript_19152:824-1099(+)